MTEEKIIKSINEDADSIEIGTPKTCKIKVYGNFNKKEEFKNKIECAIELKTFALEKLGK